MRIEITRVGKEFDDGKKKVALLRFQLRMGIRISNPHVRSERNSNAGPEGVEPPSKVLETSILPLNYGPKSMYGVPEWTRTTNLQIRNLMLCPIELRELLIVGTILSRRNDKRKHTTNSLPHRLRLHRQMSRR